jgi:hypothetical protein
MSPKLSTCSRCGSTQLVPGKFLGDGAVEFKPAKIKKFFSLTGSVRVSATACLDCGTLDISIDPAALIDLAGEPDAGGAAAT